MTVLEFIKTFIHGYYDITITADNPTLNKQLFYGNADEIINSEKEFLTSIVTEVDYDDYGLILYVEVIN
jgi:hypothetical protein